jgi:hypothetical protein
MNAKKLPFEPTDQIKRYLGEILNFNENFFGQNTKDIFLIDRYIPEVDPVSYKSETNIDAFWEYLEKIGAIEYLTDGKQVVLVNFPNIDGDESFAFPKNEKIRILSVEKIKKLQERISDPAPAAVDTEESQKPKNVIGRDQVITKVGGDYFFLDNPMNFGDNTQYKDLFDAIYSNCIQENFVSYEKINDDLLKRGWENIPNEKIKKRIQNAITNGIFRFAKIGKRGFKNINPYNKEEIIKIKKGRGINFNNIR